ncbi:MAG TPA: transglutaminase family protein [Burkholderiales bacterium]|nr:transglutaminase family protein [Burkholderiales bacterium]
MQREDNKLAETPSDQPDRKVRLEFEIKLHYDVAGPSDFICNIHAAETLRQRVVAEQMAFSLPLLDAPTVESDVATANRYLRFRSPAGKLEVKYAATVDLFHHLQDPATIGETPIADLPPEALTYLLPSRYCQSDVVSALARKEFGGMPPGYARIQAICDWVHDRTKFKIGASNPSTTALDTYEHRIGVCRDFAHLTITMCRALNVPARFISALDYGADPALGPPDFHAYAECFLGGRWYIFDSTRISPRTGLLRLGTGRDAADVAFATIFGPVKTTAPQVWIRAVDDPVSGILPPLDNGLAVSTDGPGESSPVDRVSASSPG